MAKLIIREVTYYSFYCCGCKRQHTYSIFKDGSQWNFNGNLQAPSFTPSLLNREIDVNGQEQSRCHLFVTDGKIIYCNDCTHEFAGKTLPLVEI